MTHLGPSLRRRRRRARPWIRISAALAVSLLVNGAALRLIHVGIVPGSQRQEPRPVELAPLSRAEWDANRRVASAASPGAAAPLVPRPVMPPPAKPPPQDRIKGQVVDVAPSANQTPPKESRFLAEHDSSVEKETRSRHAHAGFENTLPKPSDSRLNQPTNAQREPVVAAGAGGRNGVKVPGAPPASPSVTPRPLRPPSQTPEQKLALRLDPTGDLRLRAAKPAIPGDSQRPAVAGHPATREEPPFTGKPAGEDGQAGLPGKQGPLANLQLRPSAASYERLTGGPAPDKLDGVEEGEGTFLNTRGWKYAGYFNRISQAVRVQWDPSTPLRARDPSGTRFGGHDWTTLLVVKLDDHGSLKDVSVEKSSGLDFLDNAAVQALHRAQPFVNPPRGLADEHGEIVFSYGFTLQGGFGLDRIFRRGPSE